ncbi:MAG: NUDIX domain-containing protein [Eubacterium sp.]|nr:NUDIX domain-containing protein [Eubacterium sp.]
MKLIKEITDKDILGTDGISTAKPRLTARAILKRNDGLYAVMYSEKFNLYSLVGGGVEENEDIITALKREILEETGCECYEISELGYVYENRAHCDYTQYSYYFVVTTNGAVSAPEMTDNEIANSTSCKWKPLDEVIDLIRTPTHSTNQRKFLQARDVAALNAYVKTEKI